ncbi:hypothetical protein [Halosimplex halobium]|uniref:hypothetical protein n=1 Tax=Halosimplex halobium TaxID=3396618 RepID=UPI003F56BB52
MNRSIGLAFVVCLAILSGCPSSDGGQIVFVGESNSTESGFELTGAVTNSEVAEPTHRNVTLYLLTANGSTIASEHLRTLREDTRLNVTIRTDEVPTYVIINSPNFWTHERISVSYYEVEDGGSVLNQEMIGSKDEFPVTVPPNSSR